LEEKGVTDHKVNNAVINWRMVQQYKPPCSCPMPSPVFVACANHTDSSFEAIQNPDRGAELLHTPVQQCEPKGALRSDPRSELFIEKTLAHGRIGPFEPFP